MRLLSIHFLSLSSTVLAGGLATGCQTDNETAKQFPQTQVITASHAYTSEEDKVYNDVLRHVLRQAYWADVSSLRQADGSLLIPAPAPDSSSDKWAYYERYVAQHPLTLTPPFVLNLSPTLRDLPAFMAENGGILPDTAHPLRRHALQALTRVPVLRLLSDRPYAPELPPPVWKYGLYWRYQPFRQYADPEGSAGMQLGLQLSRVCFNAARDSGFFFYDVDYQQYVLGRVGLVRKRENRWTLQEVE